MTTAAPAQVTRATHLLVSALVSITGIRVITSIGKPITPPAVVLGPPRLLPVRVYNSLGAPMTAQWNVYYVVPMNEYALDTLSAVIADMCAAIEQHTPGVVMGSAPGTYPSALGALPCYVTTVQMEI